MMASRRRVLLLVLVASCPVALAGGTQRASASAQPEQEPAKPEEKGFANPELLVNTEWLAEHAGEVDLRIVDTRSEKDYVAGHLPDALSIPRSVTFDAKGPGGSVAPPEQIAKLFGSMGIDEKVHVVLYDEGQSTAAARVFWTLEYYGHPNVSVLDGGFGKWKAEEREVTQDESETTSVEFSVVTVPERLSTKKQLLAGIGKAEVVMLDARSRGEYTGSSKRGKRGGHIPGAIHIDWVENFTDGKVPVFKSPKELAKLYEEACVSKDKAVHAY